RTHLHSRGQALADRGGGVHGAARPAAHCRAAWAAADATLLTIQPWWLLLRPGRRVPAKEGPVQIEIDNDAEGSQGQGHACISSLQTAGSEPAAAGAFQSDGGGMTSVGARLARFRQKLGLSQDDLAARLGIAERTYQAYERNETEPKCHVLKALAEIGGDPTWIVTGRSVATGPAPGRPANDWNHGLVEIPHFSDSIRLPDEAAIGGSGAVGPLLLSADWARAMTECDPNVLVHAIAVGDEMEPLLGRGDLMLIDSSERSLSHDRTYAFLVRDTLLIRRICRRVSGEILLLAEKSCYPSENFPTADTADGPVIIGQVVWHGRRIGV
ncbi:XRE family transcriptional regulator, partial [Zavarzinia sp.]|uniref:XRE family transcriptional regulator n=1 Tax=Zavarzinia sp. TaxID=2027920 RepID=UPI00356A9995